MRKLLSLLVIFIASFSLQAQMDSISVNVYTEGGITSPIDSTIILPMVKLELYVDDFDFFGELFVEVADATSNQVFYRAKYKAQQIIDEELMTDGVMQINLIPQMGFGSYKITAVIKNYSGTIHSIIVNNL